MSTTRSICPKGPATDPGTGAGPAAEPGDAVILCAHGVRARPGIAEAHARALEQRARYAAVRACCLFGTPDLATTVHSVDAARIHVVPLLMADGYTSRTALPRAVARAMREGRPLHVHPPVGLHPAMSELIRDQAHALCRARGWAAETTALVLAAHGSPRDSGSRQAAQQHAARLATSGTFARVAAAFLELAPRVPVTIARLTTAPDVAHVVVVGLFLDSGPHGRDDMATLLRPFGETVAYAGPIGTAPGFVDIIAAALAAGRGADADTAA
ncbi:MAG: hypothetical protein D6826_01390 [Alphaproteobacteria bacterium]|nr:MAG: hypothetical protein D6826_01390 [Alphaproteobacteria bacterium]